MSNWIFISLLLTHIIGDFYLQNDSNNSEKIAKKFKSPFLYFHALIIGGLSWLLIFTYKFWMFALAITITHFFIDLIKTYSKNGVLSFIIDQTIHVVVLVIIAHLFHDDINIMLKWINFSQSYCIPLLLLAWLICMRATNIFIKLVLNKYNVGESTSCIEIKNAGALIGNLERTLTLLFIIIGHFEAIGFIIAAKSILRFRDSDKSKAEYVLAGTFLSFTIAIICGVLSSD